MVSEKGLGLKDLVFWLSRYYCVVTFHPKTVKVFILGHLERMVQ